MLVEISDSLADSIIAIECPDEDEQWTADGDAVNCHAGEVATCFNEQMAAEIAATHNQEIKRQAIISVLNRWIKAHSCETENSGFLDV